MAVMFMEETKALIEALLFVSKEPLSLSELSEITGVEINDLSDILIQLVDEYRMKKGGFLITEVAGGFQFTTRSEFANHIEKLYRPNSGGGLSKAALETLAIIAYKQPVTRAEVELIRGVKIDSAINTLVEKKLIQEMGRKEGIGRPMLFGTTPEFLKYFGLKDLSELPPPEELIIQQEIVEESEAKDD